MRLRRCSRGEFGRNHFNHHGCGLRRRRGRRGHKTFQSPCECGEDAGEEQRKESYRGPDTARGGADDGVTRPRMDSHGMANGTLCGLSETKKCRQAFLGLFNL